MAGISRPASPAYLAAATPTNVGPAPSSAGLAAVITSAVERRALEVRVAKAQTLALATAAPIPASGDSSPVSKDPAYYSQYLRDIHTVIRESFAKAAARDGITDEREWIFIPLPSELLDRSFFKRVELIRSKAIAEGGFGRGEMSLAQLKFNKMVFDVIQEILASINDHTSMEFTPGIGAAGLVVGVKGEHAAITSFNFISKIERKMLDILFPKREKVWVEGRLLGSYVERPETAEEYVDRIARESAGEAVEREHAHAARMLANPAVVKAMEPYVKPYMAVVPDPYKEMTAEERAARTKEAERLAAEAYAAGERVFIAGSTPAPATSVGIGGCGAFRAHTHAHAEVQVVSRSNGVISPATPRDDAADSARSVVTASAATVGSVSPGSTGASLIVLSADELG